MLSERRYKGYGETAEARKTIQTGRGKFVCLLNEGRKLFGTLFHSMGIRELQAILF